MYPDKFISDLYAWVQNLEPKVPASNDPMDKIWCDTLNAQLEFAKILPESEYQQKGWHAMLSGVSKAFMDYYFRYKDFGVRIGNYFECFVKCSDDSTKKHLMYGFPNSSQEIGSIEFTKHDEITAEIGEKSDLLWHCYSDFFLFEDDYSFGVHTLANHNEIFSLKIWNIPENQPDVEGYINKYLLEAALNLDLRFSIKHPSLLWKEEGHAGFYTAETNDVIYEHIPASYISYGINCSDSRMAYLHLYQGIEYFFVRAQMAAFRDSLKQAGSSDTQALSDQILWAGMRKFHREDNERASLKKVISAAVSAEWVRNVMKNHSEIASILKDNRWPGKTCLVETDNDNAVIEHLTNRIYFFRCAIAHAKGDVDEYMALPLVSNQDIDHEIPLLAKIAYAVLCHWSKEN